MHADAKKEILDAIEAAKQESREAIETSAEELNNVLMRVITDQINLRSDFAGAVARLDALEARGSSWDSRLTAHTRWLSETKADLDGSLKGVAARHDALARDIDHVKTNVEGVVLGALETHVERLEKSADKLTRSPRVRTAATIGGAFAGTATIAALFELLKHL